LDEQQARQSIVEAVKFLEDKGLNHGSAGNVSLRLGDDLLITPTGGRGSTMKPEDIVRLALDGTVKGEGIASSEWRFHTGILGRRPDAHAVVHTHADCCVALSCLRKPIPAFHYMIASFGGNSVPCSKYEPFGSKALADVAVEAIEGHYACFLANHGMIVTGRSLKHAIDLTVKLETLARQYILARQAGEPVLLGDAEMAEVHRRYGTYGTTAMPQ